MTRSGIRVFDDGSPMGKSIISFLKEHNVDFEVFKSYDFRVELGLVIFRNMEEFRWVMRNTVQRKRDQDKQKN